MLEKLKDKGYLVLDGAMGSNLFLLGLINHKKVHVGFFNVSLGFGINTKLHHFFHTEIKRKMLRDLSIRIDQEKAVPIDVIRSYTHKAAWAVQISEPLRPFLQPLFGFIHATEDKKDHERVIPPDLIRFVNRFLQKQWASESPPSAESRRHLGISSASEGASTA